MHIDGVIVTFELSSGQILCRESRELRQWYYKLESTPEPEPVATGKEVQNNCELTKAPPPAAAYVKGMQLYQPCAPHNQLGVVDVGGGNPAYRCIGRSDPPPPPPPPPPPTTADQV